MTNTLLIAMLPFVIATSALRDWVAVAVGIVSFIWISYQLIARIRMDLSARQERKQQSK